jgi:hypothetical protein
MAYPTSKQMRWLAVPDSARCGDASEVPTAQRKVLVPSRGLFTPFLEAAVSPNTVFK